MGEAAATCLEIKGLTKRFGGFYALNELDMAVAAGHIHALIGPNGAGKTTFFNLITGVLSADEGAILFEGGPLAEARPSRRTARGIARTFQNIRLFPHLTVLETVMIGEHCRAYGSTWKALGAAALRRPFGEAPEEQRMRENAMELLAFLGLAGQHEEKASNLSYGEQRKLEMARALATQPRLLLLDEPAAGLNPHETAELDETITRIRDRGVTVVLIEHDMNLVMGISDRVTVLNFGTKIAEGTPSEVQAHPAVLEAYLGEDAKAMTMLALDGVRAGYGNVEVLHDVRLEIAQGQIVALIGANGAGKTTLLKTISGLIRPSAGVIAFEGQDIARRPAHKIVSRGISHVPEGRAILKRMSVLENLRMGAYVRSDSEIEGDIAAVMARFPVLAERHYQPAGTLSGGEQQMLAIARALVARPRLLLMDEPSLGLAPKLVTGVFHTLRQLREEGKTILLVEQNARQALQVADYAYVMERGRIVLAGTGASLLDTPQVQRTYLGRRAA